MTLTPGRAQPRDPDKAYFCSHDGYHPQNRAAWCELGCGSDYNRMIEVPQRLVDKLLASGLATEAENVQLLKRLAFFTDGDQTITVGRKFLKDLEWAATSAEARVTELEAALRLSKERATLILRLARSAGTGLDEKNALSKIEHEAEHWLGLVARAALAKEDAW